MDWNNIDICSNAIDKQFFLPFYEELYQTLQEHPRIWMASPVVGVLDGMASLIQAVGGAAEAALKGVRNLLVGAARREGSCFKRGALQLLGGAVIATVSIPIIFFRILRLTKGICFDPERTIGGQAQIYRDKVAAASISI